MLAEEEGDQAVTRKDLTDFRSFFFFFFFFNRVYSDKTNTATFTGLSYSDTHTHTQYLRKVVLIWNLV